MAEQIVDRVQQASLRKDGTPDQTEDYEIIGDRDAAVAAEAERLAQMATSAEGSNAGAGEPEHSGPTAEGQARIDANKATLEAAKAEAEAVVDAHMAPEPEPAPPPAPAPAEAPGETPEAPAPAEPKA